MIYHVSYRDGEAGRWCAMLVRAKSESDAWDAWLDYAKPRDLLHADLTEARRDDIKPGKPILAEFKGNIELCTVTSTAALKDELEGA